MKHAQAYNDYWNSERIHSGKGMKNMTPKQKLLQQGYFQAEKILDFKVLYLDSHFYELQRHLEFFLLQRKIKNTSLEKIKKDRKACLEIITQYKHLKVYAQNVLTYYLRR